MVLKVLSYSQIQHKSFLLISVILLITMIACSNKPKPTTTVNNSIKVTDDIKATTNNANTDTTAKNIDLKDELQFGKSIEKELEGNNFHTYKIKLETNQYLKGTVEQKGIDLVVSIYNPLGEKVFEIDSPNGTEGPELIYFISPSAGNYLLEVRSLDKNAAIGKYEVNITELRTSTPEDIVTVAQNMDKLEGLGLLEEAIYLQLDNKPQSLSQAIKNMRQQ